MANELELSEAYPKVQRVQTLDGPNWKFAFFSKWEDCGVVGTTVLQSIPRGVVVHLSLGNDLVYGPYCNAILRVAEETPALQIPLYDHSRHFSELMSLFEPNPSEPVEYMFRDIMLESEVPPENPFNSGYLGTEHKMVWGRY